MNEVNCKRQQQLIELLTQQINAAGGWLAFEQYMQLALHHPTLGYYAAGPVPLGQIGDFITAPELGNMFARCLARFIAEAMPSDGKLLELGGGSGRLLADIHTELSIIDKVPNQYLLLDTSAQLTKLQQQNLAEVANVHWLDELPEDFVGVIIANEVLDALACEVLINRQGNWFQRGVTLENAKLGWTDGPEASESSSKRLSSYKLTDSYQTEIGRQAEGLTASLVSALQQGVILLVDYGFVAKEYYHPQRNNGTLVSHRQHTVDTDVLTNPGKVDITAHIDFSAIKQAATRAGAQLAGFTNQAAFLLDCGFEEFFAEQTSSDWQDLQQSSVQTQTLLMPHEMGEIFKVIAFSKQVQKELPGFTRLDLTSRL